jgi:hypothetical protein
VAQEFDRRIVPDGLIALLKACQSRVPFHLGGGAALAGVHLRHRLSADADLFVHERGAHRDLVRAFTDAAAELGVETEIVRDAGSLVHARARFSSGPIEIDLVHDSIPDIKPPPPTEGILVESLVDLRVNKLTCLLSRSEPRDLVDLLFLDRAGFPPERDLAAALKKDAGIDPSVLAWLLGEFPVSPLPIMLVPLEAEELRSFRDRLRERFRRISLP